MKTRKLIDGREAQELDNPIKLLIETKCPSKWKIVDMETGQAYIGTDANKKFQLRKRKKQFLFLLNQLK